MPAIGMANLKGIKGSVAGISGTYALCAWHFTEATTDDGHGNAKWANIELVGWEPFPLEVVQIEAANRPPTVAEEIKQSVDTIAENR